MKRVTINFEIAFDCEDDVPYSEADDIIANELEKLGITVYTPLGHSRPYTALYNKKIVNPYKIK